MNKAAKIIHIQVLYDPIFLFLLSNYLLVGLLGHRVNCLSQPITMAPMHEQDLMVPLLLF